MSDAPSTVPTDIDLARRACSGDRPAFQELYQRHAPAVAAFLTRYVRGADLEDCLHDALLKAWAAICRFTTGNIRSWLFPIARNVAFDRARGRREATGIDLADRPAVDRETVLAALVEREEDARRRAVLARCLGALDECERQLIISKFGGDEEHANVCGRWRINEQRGYKLRFKALEKVRKCVQESAG
jgi:RNA polymerase sigma-70 factor (ECF subfamily)